MIKETYGTMYYVDDMKKSVDFYKKTIGATPGYESDSWTEFDFGGHKLCLHSKEDGKTYDPNGVLIYQQDGIKSLYETMRGDGLKVFGLTEIHPEAWCFDWKDESGNNLSFHGKP